MCELCGSQVPEVRLGNCHYMSEKCKQVEERRLRRETLQRCFEASRVLFHNNADTLPLSDAFPYLGRTITYNNSDWAVVYLNLRKSQRRWGMIARVLEITGATVWARVAMYEAVVQLVLLYGSASSLVTGEILKVLTAFQHRELWRIMGVTGKRGAGGE